MSDFPRGPQINDNGWVVWESWDGDYGSSGIFLYDGTSTIQLANNADWHTTPQINNNGHVVWEGRRSLHFQIFGWNGSEVEQLTSSDSFSRNPDLHNGQLVYVGSYYEDIFTMPYPDNNCDGLPD